MQPSSVHKHGRATSISDVTYASRIARVHAWRQFVEENYTRSIDFSTFKRHSFIASNIDKWIMCMTRNPNEAVRKATLAIRRHLRKVTFEEFIAQLHHTVDGFFNKQQLILPRGKVIIIASTDINKSNTWVTVLVTKYMIDRYGVDIYDVIYSYSNRILKSSVAASNEYIPLIFCDDMIYSGKQLLSDHYHGIIKYVTRSHPLLLCTPYASSTWYNDIFKLNEHSRTRAIEYGIAHTYDYIHVSPTIELVPSMKSILNSINGWVDSPDYPLWLRRSTQVLIWFDHKFADSWSIVYDVLAMGMCVDDVGVQYTGGLIDCDNPYNCFNSFYSNIKYTLYGNPLITSTGFYQNYKILTQTLTPSVFG